MGENTAIEWTDHSFNPWTGCQAVSPACDHCYAEAQAKRSPKTFGGWGPHAERKRTSAAYWRQPLTWNRKAEKEGRRFRVFCASMADVFDNAVPEAWRCDLWDMIAETPHLDWLLLTKRPSNIAGMLPQRSHGALMGWGPVGYANVWLGTTVENQAEADRRIPHLLAVPAAVHFLSCEPLLCPVAIREHWLIRHHPGGARIDWIIAGGESGPKARPSHPDWFRSLRDQCVSAGVPFFFKQWGEWAPADAPTGPPTYLMPDGTASIDGTPMMRAGKKAAGAMLDGREWREIPGG